MMECGHRLLGFLEVSGAVLFTTGLAVRAAVERLSSNNCVKTPTLAGHRVLVVLGDDWQLGSELIKQFQSRGCYVAYAGPQKHSEIECPYFEYSILSPQELTKLYTNVQENFGELDILVYSIEDLQSLYKEPIDEVVDLMDKNLVGHFHVVTKFVPSLAKRSGRFVTIEPRKTLSRTFSVTNLAITALSDTLIQQIALSGNGIKVTRAIRRTRRRNDQENIHDSATAILNAVETGRTSVTLPTAKQHIKNLLRHVCIEMQQFWNNNVTKQPKLMG